MGYLDFLYGEEEEEEVPQGELTFVIPEIPYGSPSQLPATPAYDRFIEGPSLRTGTEDVPIPDLYAEPGRLETYADRAFRLRHEPRDSAQPQRPFPTVPSFRQVADYTAQFASVLPGLDAEKSRKITELQMLGEQEMYLDREDPGMMHRQAAKGYDFTKYNPETEEFDRMLITTPRRHEHIDSDHRTAMAQEPVIEDPSTPEGQAELRRRLRVLDGKGLLEYYKPSDLDPQGGAYGVTQIEAQSMEDGLNYLRIHENDGAPLRAFFMSRGLDMDLLETKEGRGQLINEITYNLETQDDPAFAGAVNAMYLFNRNRPGDAGTMGTEQDVDITNTEGLIEYMINLQAPHEDHRDDYRRRLREYLTR